MSQVYDSILSLWEDREDSQTPQSKSKPTPAKGKKRSDATEPGPRFKFKFARTSSESSEENEPETVPDGEASARAPSTPISKDQELESCNEASAHAPSTPNGKYVGRRTSDADLHADLKDAESQFKRVWSAPVSRASSTPIRKSASPLAEGQGATNHDPLLICLDEHEITDAPAPHGYSTPRGKQRPGPQIPGGDDPDLPSPLGPPQVSTPLGKENASEDVPRTSARKGTGVPLPLCSPSASTPLGKQNSGREDDDPELRSFWESMCSSPELSPATPPACALNVSSMRNVESGNSSGGSNSSGERHRHGLQEEGAKPTFEDQKGKPSAETKTTSLVTSATTINGDVLELTQDCQHDLQIAIADRVDVIHRCCRDVFPQYIVELGKNVDEAFEWLGYDLLSTADETDLEPLLKITRAIVGPRDGRTIWIVVEKVKIQKTSNYMLSFACKYHNGTQVMQVGSSNMRSHTEMSGTPMWVVKDSLSAAMAWHGLATFWNHYKCRDSPMEAIQLLRTELAKKNIRINS